MKTLIRSDAPTVFRYSLPIGLTSQYFFSIKLQQLCTLPWRETTCSTPQPKPIYVFNNLREHSIRILSALKYDALQLFLHFWEQEEVAGREVRGYMYEQQIQLKPDSPYSGFVNGGQVRPSVRMLGSSSCS